MQTMMWTKLSVVAVAFLASTVSGMKDIKVGSSTGQVLMQNARRLENNQDADYSFVSSYAIKFQGCHHVSQWNADAEDEDDVRILTKRLVLFRLCPTESCDNDKSIGCSSKYGDYVVDLNTFVLAYLTNLAEEKEQMCEETKEDCNDSCDGDDNCMYNCYVDMDMTVCFENDDDDNGVEKLDPLDYSECAQYEFNNNNRRKLEEDAAEYYLGPYCADQGGEIHLGVFTDDTCTSFASNGNAYFYTYEGYELPYSEQSLISPRCISCSSQDDDGNYEVKEMCQETYAVSGKCETKMNVEYPNESACTYVEGIKIIRSDGVIRTSAVKKSKAAAVCIGMFLTAAVLLAGYVYYLRTKLGRAKINLSAAAQQSLT